MADTGGAKEMVEAKHIAAVLNPEKGRAPVLNKDIATLTERMKKDGGKSVFQAEVADKEDDVMVNFDQMRRVLDDERRRVAAETDPAKKADLQKRLDRLSVRYGTYDKMLNYEGYNAMTPEEKRDLVNIMVTLPGFSESISLITGGRLSIDQVNKFLQGGGGVVVTPDERKAINAIVEQFAMSDKLHTRIAKNLTALEMPSEDAAKMQQIVDLKEKVRDEATKKTQLSTAETTISDFETRPTTEQERVNNLGSRADKLVAQLDDVYKPTSITKADIDVQVGNLTTATTDAERAFNRVVGGGGRAGVGDAERAAWQKLAQELTAAKSLQALFTPATADNDYKDFSKVEDARTKKTKLTGELKEMEKVKAQILQLEGERGNYASKFIRKMETALPEEMKRFWNDVVINKAVQAASAEAAIKAEKTTGEQNEAQKREQTANAILEKYLKIAYLKYKDGKVVGWDDKAIKDFMHKDLLSQSPRKLTRSQLEKVYTESGNMPPEYRKEIKKLLGDMGVGLGTPPLTFRQALDKLPDSWYDTTAAKTVPDMLGYAWGRGYYFDRMKLKGGEAEFLRQAYPPEFFEKAFEARQAEFDMAQKMLNDQILGGGVTTKEALKKVFGKDWTQGMKRVMKTAAVAGALGTGVFLAGGGLVANPMAGGPFAYDLGRGLTNVLTNLGNVKDAALQTAALASRASGKAVEASSTFIAQGANRIINP